MEISAIVTTNGGSSWEEKDEDVECGDTEKQTLLQEITPSIPPPSRLTYRPLQVSDRDQIQELHEEWFPVSYKDEFYDDLVLQRMVNSGEELFTYAAVYTEEGEEGDAIVNAGAHDVDENDAAAASSCNEQQQTKSLWEQLNETSNDHIAACIVGSFVDVSQLSIETRQLLVADSTIHTRMFYIMTLGTMKEFRHYGLATTLLCHVMEQVELDAQCGTLYLHVITFNEAAIRFYEKLGFYRVTEMKDYYRIDDQNFNCYVYAKYYHGNQGQKDYYYLLTSLVSTIWKKVTGPFALGSAERQCSSSSKQT